MSLVLYLPLPTPILADLINASFPRLWAHSALLRRTLWSPDSVPLPKVAGGSASKATASGGVFGGFVATLREVVLPAPVRAYFTPSLQPRQGASTDSRTSTSSSKPAALSKKDRDFARKRYAFFAVCAVGLVGWGFGTGAFPVPFAGKWAALLQGKRRPGWIRFAAGDGSDEGYDDDDWEEGELEDEDEDEDDGLDEDEED